MQGQINHSTTRQLDYEKKRKTQLIQLLTIFSIVYLVGYAVTTFIVHRYGETAFLLALVLVGIANIIIFRFTKNEAVAGSVIIVSFFALVVLLFYVGGIDNSGFIWMFILAPMSYYLQGLRAGLIWSGCLLLCEIILYLLSVAGLTPRHFTPLFIGIIFSAYILLMLFLILYEIVRKKYESDLRTSEEKYRAIIENIEDGYYEVDLKGNVVLCNSSLERMLGYDHDELIRMDSRRYMDEINAKEVFATFNEVYRTKMPAKTMDWVLIRKNGDRVFVETSVTLVEDARGNPLGFRGIIRDVTERKHAEENRQQLEHRLHRAEKMEALGNMAGGVAHDLNNVLGVLVGYSELVLMEIDEGNPIRKYVTNILLSGKKGAAIIQDLLTLARRGVAVAEVVNLNRIVEDFFKTPEFEKLTSYHPNVSICAELGQNLLNIKGSPVHLEKTVMNLLSNATEAISAAQGKVTIRTQNLYIDKSVTGYDDVKEGDYVSLTVADSGTGISPADMGKIFEPFYTKKVMGRSGTGLGLAIVWGTVKDHQGYIDVQSKEGEGSEFTLYFPVTREEIAAIKEQQPVEVLAGNGESILVIDDVQEQRELAANMLGKLGYKVATVAGGEEAVEYLKTSRADLLILDMIMDPAIDGMETFRRILKINPRQKAIIVSGFSETSRVKEAQQLGAGAYVKKPYQMETIGLAIKKELSRDNRGLPDGRESV